MTRAETLRGQLASSLLRLSELQRRAERTTIREQVLPRAFDELQRALTELEVAVEELRDQNSRLEIARAEADAERSRWRALFDHAPLPYVLTDAAANIRSVNDAGAELLAISRRFLAGKPLVLFIDGGRDEFMAQVGRAMASSEPTVISCTIRPRERARQQVTAHVHRFDLPEGVAGLWWIFR